MVNRKFVEVASGSKENAESVIVHHVPFKVEYDGPANVDDKFTSKTVSIPENPKVLINQFRGRPLHGQKLELPKSFEGIIATDLRRSSGLGDNVTETVDVSIVNRFDSMTYWNWDRVPSGMDKQMKLTDWLELSDVLHEPISCQKD